MFRCVLDNICTNFRFFVCKYFNEVEICFKFCSKKGMWYCREEVVLWCSCKLKVIIIFNWEVCNFRRFGFLAYLSFKVDSVNVREVWVVFGQECCEFCIVGVDFRLIFKF